MSSSGNQHVDSSQTLATQVPDKRLSQGKLTQAETDLTRIKLLQNGSTFSFSFPITVSWYVSAYVK